MLLEPEARGRAQADAQADADRAVIKITHEEHRVTDEAIAALATDKALFQRQGRLVHIVRDESKLANVIRAPDAPRIVALQSAGIRERLVRVANFKRYQKADSTYIPAHPPDWCVPQIEARGQWPQVRPLENVVETPVLRPDGSVITQPGYDELTGLLFEPTPGTTFLQLPDSPDLENAQSAAEELFDVVADFPFKTEAHKSAWLAGLLTPFARYAFPGPTPMFLADANTPAAGKSLLMDVLAVLVHGRPMPRITVPKSEDDWKKLLTSLLLSGGTTMLLDNLKGKLGGSAFEALLTGTSIQDRLLGGNSTAPIHAFAVWYATGNNCHVSTDMIRRIAHIRLESKFARPQDRPEASFMHPQLLAWTRRERPRLVRAILTILRAYYLEGRPTKQIVGWGSFPGWERLIPQVITWMGYADPGETLSQFSETSDTDTQAIEAFIAGLVELGAVSAKTALTCRDIAERIRDDDQQMASHPENVSWPSLREGISGFGASVAGRGCDPARLGYALRGARGKVVGSHTLMATSLKKGLTNWYAHPNTPDGG